MSEKRLYPFPRPRPESRTEDESYAVLKKWWNELENDKGGRAALKRASSITEAMFVPAYYRLLKALRERGYTVGSKMQPYLAVVAALAARLEDDIRGKFGEQLGTPKSGKKPVFSELRMRRILACDDLEELYTLLRRSIAVLDERASLSSMAATIWHWAPLAEKRPTDSRRQLAYDYYNVAPIRP